MFFLDRDGVLIKDRGNISKTNDILFLPGVPEALKEIKKQKFLIIIITNQSVVGRGILSEDNFKIYKMFLIRF